VRFKAFFFWRGQNGAKGKSRAFLLLKCIILMDFNNDNKNRCKISKANCGLTSKTFINLNK
jgi:hypothetical protein